MPHEHYYTPNPTSDVIEKKMTFEIGETHLDLLSVSGVFGFSNYVDKASKMLIHAFSPTGPKVLDLGCGFGAIGLSIKAIHSELDVVLSDINSRAITYASKNAEHNNLEVSVVLSDLFEEFSGKCFNDIVTNPAIASGKAFLNKLIDSSFEHLEPGGALWLVAFHNKGGSTLKNLMRVRFGNAVDIEKGGGIRVYKSIKPE